MLLLLHLLARTGGFLLQGRMLSQVPGELQQDLLLLEIRVINALAARQGCLFGAIVFISHISQYIWSENMHKHDWNLPVLPQRTNCSETVKLWPRKTLSRSSKRGRRDSTAPSSQPQALAVPEQTSHGHKSGQKESF